MSLRLSCLTGTDCFSCREKSNNEKKKKTQYNVCRITYFQMAAALVIQIKIVTRYVR
jgi:hypothetical protein